MKVFVAKCIYPGKEQEDSGYGPKVSATFIENGKEDKKENRIYVNEKPDGRDAKRLLALKKDQAVILVHVPAGGNKKPYYKLAELSKELLDSIKGGNGDRSQAPARPETAQNQPQTNDRNKRRVSPQDAGRIAVDCYEAVLSQVAAREDMDIPENVLGLLASKVFEEVSRRL